MINSSDFKNNINIYAYNLTLEDVETFLKVCQKKAVHYYCKWGSIEVDAYELPRKDELFINTLKMYLKNNGYKYNLDIEEGWIDIKWGVTASKKKKIS